MFKLNIKFHKLIYDQISRPYKLNSVGKDNA